MPGKHCKLYDENLVRHIMISTGISLYEFLQKKKEPAIDDICEFVEKNADTIIENTIEDMNSSYGTPDDPVPEDDNLWDENAEEEK
jgi:hypothetical protein